MTQPAGWADPALDAALLAAHDRGDTGALIGLYASAGDRAAAAGSPDPAAFFRTHAYIFALEADDPRAADLHAALKAAGREA